MPLAGAVRCRHVAVRVGVALIHGRTSVVTASNLLALLWLALAADWHVAVGSVFPGDEVTGRPRDRQAIPTTTFPRARPCSMWAIAAGISANG